MILIFPNIWRESGFLLCSNIFSLYTNNQTFTEHLSLLYFSMLLFRCDKPLKNASFQEHSLNIPQTQKKPLNLDEERLKKMNVKERNTLACHLFQSIVFYAMLCFQSCSISFENVLEFSMFPHYSLCLLNGSTTEEELEPTVNIILLYSQ
uniref:Uncharacterized protein n=1 Tax=Micrurus lemniscatus lemniscatus TaxID=129467 RepID=A0A2D4JSG1_MICLE